MGAARKGGAFPQNGAAEPLTTRDYHMDEVARGKITGLAHIRRGGSCVHAPPFWHRQCNTLRGTGPAGARSPPPLLAARLEAPHPARVAMECIGIAGRPIPQGEEGRSLRRGKGAREQLEVRLMAGLKPRPSAFLVRSSR